MKSTIVAATAALACLALPARAGDIHPNSASGVAINQSFGGSDLDHVNLFNGSLTVTLPLGPRFQVSSHLSYSFTLVNTSSPWTFSEKLTPELLPYTGADPSPCGNVGLGWRLSFGDIIPENTQVEGCSEASPFPTYDSADGAAHRFYPTRVEGDTPVAGVFYTRDGSYLRLHETTVNNVTTYVVEFPDGSKHTFAGNGEIQEMRDAFGNAVTLSRTGNQWSIADGIRTSIVTFNANDVTLDVPAFNGTHAVYTMNLSHPMIGRGCTVAGFPANSPETRTLPVPLLDAVTFPDGSSYQMSYYEDPNNCYTSGSLSRLTLRTGGRIEWQYGNYNFPDASVRKLRNKNNLGVVLRTLKNGFGTLTDPLCIGPSQSCFWTYSQAVDQGPRAVESVTTVTDPYGNVTKNYFSVFSNRAPDPGEKGDADEYGAPISRLDARDPQTVPRPLPGDPQHTEKEYLSTEVFNRAGTLLRREYLSFAHDARPSLGADSIGADAANENRRVQQRRIVYLDDGGKLVDTIYTDYDGLGHFRTAATTDTFGFNTRHSETTHWNPQGVPAPGANWVITTFDYKEQREGANVQRQYAVFDSTTGFLHCLRRVQHGQRADRHDVVVTYTARDASPMGDVAAESWFGGDNVKISADPADCDHLGAPATYTYSHGYQWGVRNLTTVQVGGASPHLEKLLDLDVDRNTGLTAVSRDPSGQPTVFAYDAMNRVTDTTPPGLATTHMTYDFGAPLGPLVTAAVGSPGAELEHEEWTLDPFGRLGQDAVTLPGPVTTRTGGVVPGPAVSTQVFALYNPMGWKTFVSEATAGGSAFGSTYLYYRPKDTQGIIPDPFGRPLEVDAADGQITQLDYKGARVARRSQKTLQQVQAKNDQGQLVWTTQPIWATTEELYDGLGRLRQVRDAMGTPTSYHYDAAGRLVVVAMKPGNSSQVRTFSYDGRGFLIREQPAESDAISYRYDAKGNVIAKATPTGTIVTSYDAAGRVTKVGTPTETLKEFVYDISDGLTGKLKRTIAHNYRWANTCTDFTVQEDYVYNAPGGRLSAVETTLFEGGPQGIPKEKWKQSYAYDGAGRITQIDYPGCLTGCTDASRPQTMTYGYGRPTAVAGFATSITYNENGTLSQIQHANEVVFTERIDPKGMARPAFLSAARGTTPLWPQEDYLFDGAGNITKIGTKSFTDDGDSRLTSATNTSLPSQPYQQYDYDAFGNLIRSYRGADKTSATYVDYQTSPTSNHLTGAAYDASGNLTAYQATTYSWDVLQQLAKVDGTGAGSEAWTHVYGAAGERVWSWRTSSTRLDTYTLRGPGSKVLSLFTKTPGSPSPRYTWEDYVYREGQLLGARFSDGTVRHFDLDHLGSVRLETDTTGTTVAYRDFWPYGEEATASTGGERMKFTGHERDSGIAGSTADDMDYMHARYYRPLVGRFLSIDPSAHSALLKWPTTWNRYTYVVNDPLSYVDPYGELWFRINGTWTYLQNVNEMYQESTDKEGNLVITVISGRGTFVTFNGGTLTLYREDGSVRAFAAVSGDVDKKGRTQIGLQRVPHRGPIPEGKYYFNPATIQRFEDLTAAQQAESLVNRGEWPGGLYSWGHRRVELTPDRSTNTYGRGGFWIHGGFRPGSGGCIDLCNKDLAFFSAVGTSGAEILVEVDYP